MTDEERKALIERLEEWAVTLLAACEGGDLGTDEPATFMYQAANQIEADGQRIAELEVALRPFARAKHIIATVEEDGTIRCTLTYAPDAEETFTLASLSNARAALGEKHD